MKKFVLMGLILMSGLCLANEFQPVKGSSGAGTFANACVTCHGVEGVGRFGFFKLTESTMPTEAIKTIVQNGGNWMPAFPNIKDEELEVLGAYVRSIGVQETSE